LLDNIDISPYIDGVRYARAKGYKTLYEEHFDPLNGRNV
jgi:hypothetical protein